MRKIIKATVKVIYSPTDESVELEMPIEKGFSENQEHISVKAKELTAFAYGWNSDKCTIADITIDNF